MSKGVILIDGNNIAHAANQAQRLSVGTLPTQAIYGFLRTLRPLAATFPMLSPIVLWDGRSWRYEHFPEYKANRNKTPTTKIEIEQAKLREQFKTQVPFIRTALKHLAVPQMFAFNYEADDLAALMVQKTKAKGLHTLLISADRDWIQLIDNSVTWFDPIRNNRISPANIAEKLGVPDARAWLEIKCLMGDVSDGIPGVGGIGEKGAIEFINQYGSVASFINGVMDKSIDVEKLHKKYRELGQNAEKLENYHRNMKLMDLNTPLRPAPAALELERGLFNEEKFRKLCETLLFKSILGDAEWIETFRPKIAKAA
jgi:5'-3' exonuclease